MSNLPDKPRGERSIINRPSVIRSVLNPSIPLGEGELTRRDKSVEAKYENQNLKPILTPSISPSEGQRPCHEEAERPQNEEQYMLDVLGHCFTDPLFQNLLRSPVSGLTALDADDVLRTAEAEEEGKESPGGFTMKMLAVSQPEMETRLSCVMAGPEICLTTEEKSRLSELFNNQVTACKGCLPVR